MFRGNTCKSHHCHLRTEPYHHIVQLVGCSIPDPCIQNCWHWSTLQVCYRLQLFCSMWTKTFRLQSGVFWLMSYLRNLQCNLLDFHRAIYHLCTQLFHHIDSWRGSTADYPLHPRIDQLWPGFYLQEKLCLLMINKFLSTTLAFKANSNFYSSLAEDFTILLITFVLTVVVSRAARFYWHTLIHCVTLENHFPLRSNNSLMSVSLGWVLSTSYVLRNNLVLLQLA